MLTTIRTFTRKHPQITLMILLLVAFILAHLLLETRPTPLASVEELNARLTDGQPTIVEFYSNL